MEHKAQRAMRALVGCFALVTFVAAIPAWAADQIVIGAGTFSSTVVRTIEQLEPSCVQLVTRVGTVQFTGVVTGDNGQFLSRALRDACADPVHGTFHEEIQLTDVTIGGITGNLIIVADGVFEGDPNIAPGVRFRAHGTVSGVSGKLRGATGLFQSVGQSTALPGNPSTAFNTYYLEIQLK